MMRAISTVLLPGRAWVECHPEACKTHAAFRVIDYWTYWEIPDDEIVKDTGIITKIEPDITYESADKSLAYFFTPGKWNLVLQGTIPRALSVRLFPVNAQTMSG